MGLCNTMHNLQHVSIKRRYASLSQVPSGIPSSEAGKLSNVLPASISELWSLLVILDITLIVLTHNHKIYSERRPSHISSTLFEIRDESLRGKSYRITRRVLPSVSVLYGLLT